MKNAVQNWLSATRALLQKLFSHTELRYAAYAILTVALAEFLNTLDIFATLSYGFRQPVSFISAVSLVFFTYMLTLLVPKRTGTLIIVFGIWLGLSIANCVLLSFRVNPLSAVDFSILFSVISIINVYLTNFQIVLICIAILSAIALAVFTMFKLPSDKPRYKSTSLKLLICALFSAAAIFVSVLVNAPNMDGMNISTAYSEHGFVYCFTMSIFDRGIDRPKEYNNSTIGNIVDPFDTSDTTDPDSYPSPSSDNPNVIIVQLESFYDPTYVEGLELTEDAIPFFRSLKEEYPSGLLEVPVSGSGTVNTEFEVLCGIPLSCFGLGEYPYNTKLEQAPCESAAYYFKDAGYTTHAIHNHSGTFYNRHIVLEKLGFNTFTPLEYMNEVEKNELSWAHDSVLTEEIIGTLDSTNGSDFVYTISVQPHGKYKREPGDYGSIKASGNERFKEDRLNAVEYYVNQLRETDKAVHSIIEELERRGEDTVVVFFGDHLPALELKDEDVSTGSIYKTEYVIWSSFELEAEDCDLESYRLVSHLLDALNMDGGVVSDYHSHYYGKDSYFTNLKELAYDIMYGDMYAYEGEFPYETTEMTFGWKEIKITDATVKFGALQVSGEGFTECSTVFVDGRKVATTYVNENLLVCPGISDADTVEVGQTGTDSKVIGEKVKTDKVTVK